MKMKTGVLLVGLAMLAGLAGAEVITINPAISGIVGWNTAIWGDPAAAPASGNQYVHDGSSLAVLSGMGTTYGSFSGDKLTLGSGAKLYNKSGGALGCTLLLDGGQWETRSPGTATLLGVIRILSNSKVLLVDGNFGWNTGLSSVDGAVLSLQNWSQAGRSMVLNATDQGFSGTFSIMDSGLNPNTWNIQFDKSYTNAILKIEGQKHDIAYAAVYQLTGDIAFKDVFMPNGSGGLVDLDPGTYDSAGLVAAGVSSSYFNDLGGSITVGSPHGYQAWAIGWGVEIGSETNDYDGDLLSNLVEYGLGGDPTNSLDMGEVPTFGKSGGALAYVHAQRADDTNLVYYLKTSLDLVSGSWTNDGYSVVGTNVTGGTFNYVTNAIPTLVDETFVRLMIETP